MNKQAESNTIPRKKELSFNSLNQEIKDAYIIHKEKLLKSSYIISHNFFPLLIIYIN